MSRSSRGDDDLLLGEWACLGVLMRQRSHGFAVAARLAPNGDLGRVWSMSRALTYRALDQLTQRGLVEHVREEQGIAGGNRTILALTTQGRQRLTEWLDRPVGHLRDMRSELLLKLLIADACGHDTRAMLAKQRAVVAVMVDNLAVGPSSSESQRDVVALWRIEASQAALRFVDRLIAG